ncbi:uncharacterized protein V2V93DRAFT_371058 [Kockiozyma suomiensis]|uniref:uncharacterized protein n=1 Tax=Kockiozyma suomiensis TaxID=1337062 RepID=UPI003342E8D3
MSAFLFSRASAFSARLSTVSCGARTSFFSSSARQSVRATTPRFSSTLLAGGATVSAVAYTQLFKSPILCDYAVRGNRDVYSATANELKTVSSEARKSRIDYRELSIGSFAGLFVGFIVGKLSKLLVFISSSTYLFLQFLESRGLISMPYNSLYSWAKKRYGDKELILENISFKVAFALAAAVAAANA